MLEYVPKQKTVRVVNVLAHERFRYFNRQLSRPCNQLQRRYGHVRSRRWHIVDPRATTQRTASAAQRRRATAADHIEHTAPVARRRRAGTKLTTGTLVDHHRNDQADGEPQ